MFAHPIFCCFPQRSCFVGCVVDFLYPLLCSFPYIFIISIKYECECNIIGLGRLRYSLIYVELTLNLKIEKLNLSNFEPYMRSKQLIVRVFLNVMSVSLILYAESAAVLGIVSVANIIVIMEALQQQQLPAATTQRLRSSFCAPQSLCIHHTQKQLIISIAFFHKLHGAAASPVV